MGATNQLVFNDVVENRSASPGLVTTYTSLEHSDFLTAAEQLLFHAIVETSGAVSNMTIQIETSADGRSWVNKQGTAEFSQSLASGVNSYMGGETFSAKPNPRFVRLRISAFNLGAGFLTFSVQVRVFATSRIRHQTTGGRNLRATPSYAPERLSSATLSELGALGRGEHSAGRGAGARVMTQLSASARNELLGLGAAIGGLSSGRRGAVASAARMLGSILDGPDSGGCVGCGGAKGADSGDEG